MTRWSLRRLKSYLARRKIVPSISVETLRSILREKNVPFQRTRSWKRSTDPLFEQKATRVLSVVTAPVRLTAWSSALMSSGPISPQPYPGHCYAERKRPWRRRATYVRKSGVGNFFGAYDFHADVLFGGYRLAKTTTEVLAFYKYTRRRYPEHVRMYLIQRQPRAALAARIYQWGESHNVELVPIPTYASYFNRIECQFQPLREFVISASDYTSHADVARAFLRFRCIAETPTTTPLAFG